MHTFEELIKDYDDVSMYRRGGQKKVFLGKHLIYGDVVIKLCYEPRDPRVLREIDICRGINSEAVPKIYDSGYVCYEGAETLYIVEEKINGTDLKSQINSGYKFSLKDAAGFLKQGLEFIAALEKIHVVHRDIKPDNIILNNEKVYFLDFGIARNLELPSLTATQAMMGPHTPGYSAPEQFNNLKMDIDSRADLFSLGVVTYECVTGVNPFTKGANGHLDILQRTETIIPINYVLAGDQEQQFMGLISSMMSKYPSRRPRNSKKALEWLVTAEKTFIY
ncbi:serine/threonine-protein kinase [Propionispira raffinosivorans]|jgi:serine/threonine-protein kinase|uniref:serine/threonine-protein kinase n=1 Tax=Propionispira raffinosivorans TaxID=86959 RepID=UPI00036317C4|nr:serine/threonine-protein kinase [Propionispira raffinosivorans]